MQNPPDFIPDFITDFRTLTETEFVARYKELDINVLKRILVTRYDVVPNTLIGKIRRTLARMLFGYISRSGEAGEVERHETNQEPVQQLCEEVHDCRFDTAIGREVGANIISTRYSTEQLTSILVYEFGDDDNTGLSKDQLVEKIVEYVEAFHRKVYQEDIPPEIPTTFEDRHDFSEEVRQADTLLRTEFRDDYSLIKVKPMVIKESFTDGWEQMNVRSKANSTTTKPEAEYRVLWGGERYSFEDWNAKIDHWYRTFPRITSNEPTRFSVADANYCWAHTTISIWDTRRRNTRSNENPFIPIAIKNKFRLDMWDNVINIDVRSVLPRNLLHHVFILYSIIFYIILYNPFVNIN